MIKLKLLLLCLGWLSLAHAQQLRPEVLASAGASMSNAANTARLSFTVGEVAILGQSLPTYSFGQGFHNAALQTVRVAELDLQGWNLEFWPNPVAHTIFLQFKAPSNGGYLQASIWNMLGQPVLGEHRLDEFSQKHIQVAQLPAGVYLLRLADPSGSYASVKFVKAD